MLKTAPTFPIASIADKITIASPCQASWDAMQGDNVKRFCGDCSQNVYNLSAMTKSDAEQWLRMADQVPCLKFYRRKDGTIIFENCPKGLRHFRDVAKAAWSFSSITFAFLFSIAACLAKGEKVQQPSNFNCLWTLSESGPTVADTNFREAPGLGPVAQMGSVDREWYLSHLLPVSQRTKMIGANWEGSDNFTDALTLLSKKKYSQAEIAFQKALAACSKPGADPMYREFVGIEYAKLLTKMGKPNNADVVKAETKMVRSTGQFSQAQ